LTTQIVSFVLCVTTFDMPCFNGATLAINVWGNIGYGQKTLWPAFSPINISYSTYT